ncbi:MAG: RNA polymerase sigma factor WhiG [Spirochaetes bacterium]|nr:RNA polymerase sigma factor WhiG [Spirochaetota bacterium]
MFEDKYKGRDEDELWQEYKRKQNQDIREHFVKKYAPLVKYVAGKVAIGMPNNTDFDDLVSDGVLGLLDAIEKYEPDRNIKFKTYAVTRIKGAIFDGLRERDWIPRSIRQKAKQVENLLMELEIKNGRPASDDEMAAALNLQIEEFNKLMLNISGTAVISLNEIWHVGSDDDEVSMIETLESPVSLNPDVLVEKNEVKNVIAKVIQGLPDKEKEVIILYYYEDLTLKEIGEVLDVTESRVSQLHTKAIMRIKAKLKQIKFLSEKE